MEKVAYRIEHISDMGKALDVASTLRAKGFRVQIICEEEIIVYAEQK
ncbi:hypothetical protein GCM10007416_31720 [Kroppenstedtia guangzhouensis]|uniref:Uncharacterized protein n=1 Tax=Kroppenstedtia guangzhouensis TaxID=1274356 RepID=A0ABQ1H296_9BACL|nr:hypothetical protein [Kroppenstedtia guangzhouensis]GGA56194.1 hypothetical protein GCM10007416_31720 [Kroppenstedtia guangzhouensis]